jgi:hypothetical protein
MTSRPLDHYFSALRLVLVKLGVLFLTRQVTHTALVMEAVFLGAANFLSLLCGDFTVPWAGVSRHPPRLQRF